MKSFCMEPSGWRLFATELWAGRVIRGWKSIQPATSADGPDDERIPLVPQVSHATLTLGYCSPIEGPDRPPGPTTVTIYRRGPTLQGSVDRPWEEVAAPRVAPKEGAAALGGVWGPPGIGERSSGHATSIAPSWPSGTYVFRIAGVTGNPSDEQSFKRWFAVAVEVLPPLAR